MKILLGVLMLMAIPAVALPIRGVGCAATAEAAVKRMLAKSTVSDVAEGFRVEAVRFDGIHGKTWALVGSCAESSRPRLAIEIPANEHMQSIAKKMLLVRSGERVTVMSDAGDSRMELMGWAESAGGEGDAMDVRLSLLKGDGTSAKLRCRVVRAGIVEVVR